MPYGAASSAKSGTYFTRHRGLGGDELEAVWLTMSSRHPYFVHAAWLSVLASSIYREIFAFDRSPLVTVRDLVHQAHSPRGTFRGRAGKIPAQPPSIEFRDLSGTTFWGVTWTIMANIQRSGTNRVSFGHHNLESRLYPERYINPPVFGHALANLSQLVPGTRASQLVLSILDLSQTPIALSTE